MDPEVVEEQEKQQEKPEENIVETKAEEESEKTAPTINPRKSIITPSYDWKLEKLDEEETARTLAKLSSLPISNEEESRQRRNLVAVQSVKKGSSSVFMIQGVDPEHPDNLITRKPGEFVALRDALVRRWPGIIFPPFPEKLAVGITNTQVIKNRMKFANYLLQKISLSEYLYNSEEARVFLKGEQKEVLKVLERLKPHKPQDLLKIYSETFPDIFSQERGEDYFIQTEKRLKNIEGYLLEMKTDLAYQKDQLKKLAQLQDKMLKEKYRAFSKLLPQFENVCLEWLNNTKPKDEKSQKQPGEEEEKYYIYGGKNYQQRIEEHQQLFLNEERNNTGWGLYELFKFELKYMDSLHQALCECKSLNNERKYLKRNVENNKKQIQDINNKKTSLKIFFLSGSTDEKKTKLATETQNLENQLRIIDELYSGISELMLNELREFMLERAKHYKQGTRIKLKNEAAFFHKMLMVELQSHK